MLFTLWFLTAYLAAQMFFGFGSLYRQLPKSQTSILWLVFTLLSVFVIPLIFGITYKRIVSQWQNGILHESEAELQVFRVPISRKAQTLMLRYLLQSYRENLSNSRKSNRISDFSQAYDQSINALEKILLLKRVKVNDLNPSAELLKLKSEYQWCLCDAIERATNYSVKEIKNTYRNSKEYQQREVALFRESIAALQDRFSAETAAFAESSVRKISLLVDNLVDHYSGDRYVFDSFSRLDDVDRMDGYQFEEWCAALLEKNGFQEVLVTQKSGDQGVDILAGKDDIRYAIQCKCYTSDLGNTPVQEVLAGKAYYGCQIGVVMTNRHFTKGAQELAQKTGVLLWDREKIQGMLLKQ